MLISYEIKDNKGCDSIKETLCLIDETLSLYTTKLYNSKIYSSKINITSEKIRDLTIYKHFLQKLIVNPRLFPSFSYQSVISKVKTLI